MQEKDSYNEVDDIIVRGIVEHGKKIDQMKKWQRGSHKSVAKRLSFVALAVAAILLLFIVVIPFQKAKRPASETKEIAYTQNNSSETDYKLAPTGKAATNDDNTFTDDDDEEEEGNGVSELYMTIESGLRELGMMRINLKESNSDSILKHLDIYVDNYYDAEWARILILAKVGREDECRKLLKEFIKKEGAHKEQAVRLNNLLGNH